jgi:hypothetical protein
MESAVPHKGLVYWLILAISAITVVTGLVQIVAPGFVLGIVGVNQDTTSEQLFATIGMFMTLFGAMLFQALRSASNQQVAVFCAAMQKLGACIAVFAGVRRHVFSTVALLIAGFDGLSGCLIFWYWTTTKARSAHHTTYG